jgi:hypothetical protein
MDFMRGVVWISKTSMKVRHLKRKDGYLAESVWLPFAQKLSLKVRSTRR